MSWKQWTQEFKDVAPTFAKVLHMEPKTPGIPVLVCTQCGHVYHQNERRPTARGDNFMRLWVGIALLCLGILPGLIYFALIQEASPRCEKCHQKGTLIPADTPRGRVLLQHDTWTREHVAGQ